jgi:hypothetical protein
MKVARAPPENKGPAVTSRRAKDDAAGDESATTTTISIRGRQSQGGNRA